MGGWNIINIDQYDNADQHKYSSVLLHCFYGYTHVKTFNQFTSDPVITVSSM